MRLVTRIGRAVLLLVGLVVALAVGWLLFVQVPTDLAGLLGVLLALGVGLLGLRVARRLGDRLLPTYNVAEVAIEGPITRDGGGRLPARPGGTPADDLVEQIERADDDPAVRALLLTLNTPGGEVGASDDLRRAAVAFDGPTVAHATDLCASGGYWIASGCDERWAREHSLVGSIGVIMSRVTAAGLAEKLGLTYEGITAGEFKDAGTPLKELSTEEREYLQGLTDGFYEDFVARVAGGVEIDPGAVRDTEARIYLGEEAHAIGLVDALGHRDDVEERLESLLGEPVSVRAFEPSLGLRARLRATAVDLAYALGAGAAGAVAGEREPALELR